MLLQTERVPKKVVPSRGPVTVNERVCYSRMKNKECQVRLITTYNNQWGDLQRILTNHWGILKLDPKLSGHVSEKASLTAHRAKNQKDYLVKSHFTRPSTTLGRGRRHAGSYPCSRCNVCPFMIPTSTVFENRSNGIQIKLEDYVNCQTCNVIYGITCPCP